MFGSCVRTLAVIVVSDFSVALRLLLYIVSDHQEYICIDLDMDFVPLSLSMKCTRLGLIYERVLLKSHYYEKQKKSETRITASVLKQNPNTEKVQKNASY